MKISVILCVLFIVSSCTVYRHIPEGERLLTDVEVKSAPGKHQEQLLNLIQDKPNRRVFGIWRLHLRMWFASKKLKWLRKKDGSSGIWEEPTYLNESVVEENVERMQLYLQNVGFFNAKVEAEIRLRGRKRAQVRYFVIEKKPYRINSVDFLVEDYDLYQLLMENQSQSYIEKGQIYSSEKLVAERDRIMTRLRKHGYFEFSRQYIYFNVDSNYQKHKLDVAIGIKNPDDFKRHKVYVMGATHFQYQEKLNAPASSDTLTLKTGFTRSGRSSQSQDNIVLSKVAYNYGALYNQEQTTQTLKELRSLPQFKYVDVAYKRIDSTDSDTGVIKTTYKLTFDKRYRIQYQLETITSEQKGDGFSFDGRLYGFATSLALKDRNFVKRGILLESQIRGASELSLRDFPNIISNSELGFSNNLYFSRPFLSRLLPENWREHVNNSTVGIKLFTERNPDFGRSTINLNAGYTAQKGNFRHYILPIDFNLVQTRIISNAFRDTLNNSDNLYLRNLFDNHTISGSRWGMYYSNKVIGTTKNYLEVSANVLELAGNSFWALSQVFGKSADAEQAVSFDKTLLGMHFFQYIKSDYDARYHIKTFWNNEIVCRLYAGMIWPYGNTDNAVPFEKRYYAGGSNSIRGWSVRTLGPGAFSPQSNEDFVYFHSGDIKLESNLEYRFDVSDLIKMALFVDAGNIWNHPSNNFQVEGGAWNWGEFYKQIAVAGGLGVRFDFNYFVFRTDLGMPFRDPAVRSQDLSDLWFPNEIYSPFSFNRAFQVNFGIGYPF